MKTCLTIDMGGTAIKYGVLDETLTFGAHGVIPARCGSEAELFADLQALYEQYGRCCDGVAVSMPGVIDRFAGFAKTGLAPAPAGVNPAPQTSPRLAPAVGNGVTPKL